MLNLFLNFYASTTGIIHTLSGAWWRLIRRILIYFGDPSYETTIRGKKIRLPVSHNLPLYVANHRFYDELPIRLSNYLYEKQGHLSMIDVGANIGDTIVSCYRRPDDQFLAVEANPVFAKYLKQNCAHIENLTLVEAFCSSVDAGQVTVGIQSAGGTAQILKQGEGVSLPEKRLDTIAAELPQFSRCNFLKIDTDGSDFDVLQGSRNILHEVRPAVLFECYVFWNNDYILDFLASMKLFMLAGYDRAVVYDNLGYIFQVFPVPEYEQFQQALFYQKVSRFGYFDILVLDASCRDFIDGELTYFESTLQGLDQG